MSENTAKVCGDPIWDSRNSDEPVDRVMIGESGSYAAGLPISAPVGVNALPIRWRQAVSCFVLEYYFEPQGVWVEVACVKDKP